MGKSHLSPKPDEDDIKDGVPLMKSPLRAPSLKQVAEAAPIETLGWQEDSDLPDFERHEEATNIEVFYDLFFAANLCVYFENRDITTIEQLSNFVAYFTSVLINPIHLLCSVLVWVDAGSYLLTLVAQASLVQLGGSWSFRRQIRHG